MDILQLLSLTTAGSIQATIFWGCSQLRTEHGMVIGTLPFPSGAGLLQANLRKFWPVGSPSQNCTVVCLLLSNPAFFFSCFRCQTCTAFQSLFPPTPAPISLLSLQFFPKYFHSMPASWRSQMNTLPLILWMLTLTYLLR